MAPAGPHRLCRAGPAGAPRLGQPCRLHWSSPAGTALPEPCRPSGAGRDRGAFALHRINPLLRTLLVVMLTNAGAKALSTPTEGRHSFGFAAWLQLPIVATSQNHGLFRGGRDPPNLIQVQFPCTGQHQGSLRALSKRFLTLPSKQKITPTQDFLFQTAPGCRQLGGRDI